MRMKTSFAVAFYAVVLCLVAAFEAALLGYMMLLLYPYHVGMNNAWPGLLLLTAVLLVTLGCIVYEFRFLKRLRTNPNAPRISASVAFWLGLTPWLLLASMVTYGVYR